MPQLNLSLSPQHLLQGTDDDDDDDDDGSSDPSYLASLTPSWPPSHLFQVPISFPTASSSPASPHLRRPPFSVLERTSISLLSPDSRSAGRPCELVRRSCPPYRLSFPAALRTSRSAQSQGRRYSRRMDSSREETRTPHRSLAFQLRSSSPFPLLRRSYLPLRALQALTPKPRSGIHHPHQPILRPQPRSSPSRLPRRCPQLDPRDLRPRRPPSHPHSRQPPRSSTLQHRHAADHARLRWKS